MRKFVLTKESVPFSTMWNRKLLVVMKELEDKEYKRQHSLLKLANAQEIRDPLNQNYLAQNDVSSAEAEDLL